MIVYCVESTRIITTVNCAGLLVEIVPIDFKLKLKSNTETDNVHDNLPTQMDETV